MKDTGKSDLVTLLRSVFVYGPCLLDQEGPVGDRIVGGGEVHGRTRLKESTP